MCMKRLPESKSLFLPGSFLQVREVVKELQDGVISVLAHLHDDMEQSFVWYVWSYTIQASQCLQFEPAGIPIEFILKSNNHSWYRSILNYVYGWKLFWSINKHDTCTYNKIWYKCAALVSDCHLHLVKFLLQINISKVTSMTLNLLCKSLHHLPKH